MSKPATAVEKMSREELLAYIKMLEDQVRHDGAKIQFLNATVRKLESDAVVTIAALVHQMGDEAIVMPSVIEELKDWQIGRTTRDDGASVFRVKKKPTPEELAAQAAEVPAELPAEVQEELPEVDPSAFKPDGL